MVNIIWSTGCKKISSACDKFPLIHWIIFLLRDYMQAAKPLRQANSWEGDWQWALRNNKKTRYNLKNENILPPALCHSKSMKTGYPWKIQELGSNEILNDSNKILSDEKIHNDSRVSLVRDGWILQIQQENKLQQVQKAIIIFKKTLSVQSPFTMTIS